MSDHTKRATDPAPEIRELAARMDDEGWVGSPLVVHGDDVVGGLRRYEAARFLGMEDEAPTITLKEVFEEAGVDMPQVAAAEGGPGPEKGIFQDYLRDLPRHIREKYELETA